MNNGITDGKEISVARLRLVPPSFASSPAGIALIWASLVALYQIDNIIFPAPESYVASSSVIYLSGTPIFVALLVCGVLGAREKVMQLIALFLMATLVTALAWFIAQWFVPRGAPYLELFYWGLGFQILYIVAVSIIVWRWFAQTSSRKRRAGAVAIIYSVTSWSGQIALLDSYFYELSDEATEKFGITTPSTDAADEDSFPPEIENDKLWESQPALLEKAIAATKSRVPGRMNIYALAVAPLGTQTLFAREAHYALRTIKATYGANVRSEILLSNGADDLLHVPLATRGNIAKVASGMGRAMNPARDLLFVYLTSHGSKDATLSSSLPRYQSIQPISATSLASALRDTPIKRRIIVVSACYSGSWIKALADDDTIIITAAASDRTSFGCSDTRQLTYFGEAFLKRALRPGLSLEMAFAEAKQTVNRWEKADKAVPSLPQAYVGTHMQTLWKNAVPFPEKHSGNGPPA
jgi:hypothetical protein